VTVDDLIVVLINVGTEFADG